MISARGSSSSSWSHYKHGACIIIVPRLDSNTFLVWLTSARSQRTAIILATLDKKIDGVLSEEKAAKVAQEEHEKLREQLIAELQAKSKKGRDGKDGTGEDMMEVDDMGTGGMTGSVGALLGFGAKKTKYVLRPVLSGM